MAIAPIQMSDDDFTLFGLPRRFDIDRDALDSAWRGLQSRVHPDRHTGAGAQGLRIAMQWSARVNEAHQRLRDPLRRAAYLCDLRGAPIDAERNTAMPLAFLQDQMAWREALDDAGDDASLDALQRDVDTARQGLLSRIGDALDVSADASTAATHVRALMFVEKFRDDLGQRREALEADHE